MAKRLAAAQSAKVSKSSKGEVVVVGRGFRKADHALVWMVTSQTEVNRWHQVTQMPNGQLACDCKGAHYGRRTCAHRDAVYADLAAEAQAFAATQRHAAPPTPPPAETPSAPTHPGDAAPLYHDNQAVSMWR